MCLSNFEKGTFTKIARRLFVSRVQMETLSQFLAVGKYVDDRREKIWTQVFKNKGKISEEKTPLSTRTFPSLFSFGKRNVNMDIK